MRHYISIFTTLLFMQCMIAIGQSNNADQTAKNKKIAKEFYEDLWFNNHTENYAAYLNDVYIVHDIGDRKGVQEPALKQKQRADFFWENGQLNCELDFQIAEGNMVVTRWIADYEPNTMIGKVFIGSNPIPIMNAFRFENGKIVEIWNHRHDIDTNQTVKYVFKGFLFGLIISLIPTFVMIRLKLKLRKIASKELSKADKRIAM